MSMKILLRFCINKITGSIAIFTCSLHMSEIFVTLHQGVDPRRHTVFVTCFGDLPGWKAYPPVSIFARS